MLVNVGGGGGVRGGGVEVVAIVLSPACHLSFSGFP